MRVKIDDVLKAKCPKTTLGGVTALVVAQPSAEAIRAGRAGEKVSTGTPPIPRERSQKLRDQHAGHHERSFKVLQTSNRLTAGLRGGPS
jgi:hypothetical protein